MVMRPGFIIMMSNADAITGMLLRFQSLWSILSLFALAFIIAYAAKICSEGGTVDPLCFKECQEYIERVLEKE